jgi:hypothetical protein
MENSPLYRGGERKQNEHRSSNDLHNHSSTSKGIRKGAFKELGKAPLRTEIHGLKEHSLGRLSKINRIYRSVASAERSGVANPMLSLCCAPMWRLGKGLAKSKMNNVGL